jgi:hypothetical protein
MIRERPFNLKGGRGDMFLSSKKILLIKKKTLGPFFADEPFFIFSCGPGDNSYKL